MAGGGRKAAKLAAGSPISRALPCSARDTVPVPSCPMANRRRPAAPSPRARSTASAARPLGLYVHVPFCAVALRLLRLQHLRARPRAATTAPPRAAPRWPRSGSPRGCSAPARRRSRRCSSAAARRRCSPPRPARRAARRDPRRVRPGRRRRGHGRGQPRDRHRRGCSPCCAPRASRASRSGCRARAPHVLAALDRRHTPGRAVAAAARGARGRASTTSASTSSTARRARPTPTGRRRSRRAGGRRRPPQRLRADRRARHAPARARPRAGARRAAGDDVLADRYRAADTRPRRRRPALVRDLQLGGDGGRALPPQPRLLALGDWWGVGPGAHSHVGGVRWWNVLHPRAYAARLAAGARRRRAASGSTPAERRTERIMLEVRLAEGLALAETTRARRPRPGRGASRAPDAGALAGGRAVLTSTGACSATPWRGRWSPDAPGPDRRCRHAGHALRRRRRAGHRRHAPHLRDARPALRRGPAGRAGRLPPRRDRSRRRASTRPATSSPRPGGAEGPDAVVFAAHLDTVFAEGTEIVLRESGGRLAAPGCRGQLDRGRRAAAPRAATCTTVRSPRPVVLAATVGEEGLGDLRGAKALLDELDVARSSPSRARCSTRSSTAGGRLDPAAAHGPRPGRPPVGRPRHPERGPPPRRPALGRAGRGPRRRDRAQRRDDRAAGRSSTRSRARRRRRARPPRRGRRAPARHRRPHRGGPRLGARRARGRRVEALGRRPGGRVASRPPAVAAARRARETAGLPPAEEGASSTDANAAYGRGIPAITVGVTTGGNAHRLDEYIDLAPIGAGLAALEALADELDPLTARALSPPAGRPVARLGHRAREPRSALQEILLGQGERQPHPARAADAEPLAGRDGDAVLAQQALGREPGGRTPPGVERPLGRVDLRARPRAGSRRARRAGAGRSRGAPRRGPGRRSGLRAGRAGCR